MFGDFIGIEGEMKNWKSVETTKKEVVNFYVIRVCISKRKYMEVIADVIFEMV